MNVRFVLRMLKWALIPAILCGAVFVVKLVWLKPFNIDHFFERVFIETVLNNPQLLTNVGVVEQYGLNFHNAKLTSELPSFEQESLFKAQKDRATLHAYDRHQLSPEQQISYDILDWYLNNEIAGGNFLFHDYPVNQLFGVQNNVPTFMASAHPLNNETQVQYYLLRLKAIPKKFAETAIAIRFRESLGILPPKFVLERVVAEMEGFIATPAKENILHTNYVTKMKDARGFNEAAWAHYGEDAARLIENDVYPAYEKLLAVVRDQASRANTDDGVWHLPDGDAYYADRLRDATTTDATPEQVHQTGLEEVARIEAEMKRILAEVGLADKSIPDALAEIRTRPEQLFPNTEEGREAAIQEYSDILKEIEAGMDAAFDLTIEKPLAVVRIPSFKEDTAPGAYYHPPSLDGSRPGFFFANLSDMNNVPRFGMRTLAYHEGIPGHHFQLTVQQGVEGPTFRQVLTFTAYTEGWALYAEKLAWEMGFESDPYDNLGRLSAEMLRAVRLVVDTGIHHKRWTREQAIDYMAKYTGMPEDDVRREVERYIVMPGQACAYKIGELKILELRARAKEKLGGAFNLPEFHNVILQDGALPLTLLEEVVDRWIADKLEQNKKAA